MRQRGRIHLATFKQGKKVKTLQTINEASQISAIKGEFSSRFSGLGVELQPFKSDSHLKIKGINQFLSIQCERRSLSGYRDSEWVL